MTETERLKLQLVCDQLIANYKSLLLATRSVEGDADISYAPYTRDEESFYIFVSELAKHTKNLINHPQASILFIQPETEANNLFARQRLTLDCQVREIYKTDSTYQHHLDAMTEKFGEIINLLRTLPDFHLFALTPNRGQFVGGFGQAIPVDAKGKLQWPTTPD